MKKNILVSGSHRSGSTWTGQVIAKANKVRYVHEPFNIGMKRNYSPFTYWFEHLRNSPPSHQEKAKDYINSFLIINHINNFKRLLQLRSLRDIYYYLVDIKDRLLADRTLIKDPIAIMSAEWIYENFNWDIVILIRHPAAFVSSLKVVDWQFDFNNYLNQNNLMDTYLSKYTEIIKEHSKNKKDIIKQGILLWNTIHDVILYYKEKYQDEWYFVSHEDLSMNPISEFEKVYFFLNLKFNKQVRDYIIKSTTANTNNESSFKRDSKKNIKTWKSRLTNDEINQIKEGTKDIWPNFYSDDDW